MVKDNYQSRIGEVSYTKYGTKATIIKYINSKKVLIQFDDKFKYCYWVIYKDFKEGRIKNPYDKTVCNIGYLGVGDYVSSVSGVKTREYRVWHDIITRCYSKKRAKSSPTYKDCIVCDEWHNFQNFAKWYLDNYYTINNQTMCVDKDILFKGNKIYSPDTCLIVPNEINVMFEKHNKTNLSSGITKMASGKFRVRCRRHILNDLEKYRTIGTFCTYEEAFKQYKNIKEIVLKEIANKYKNMVPVKVYNAIYNYSVDITD